MAKTDEDYEKEAEEIIEDMDKECPWDGYEEEFEGYKDELDDDFPLFDDEEYEEDDTWEDEELEEFEDPAATDADFDPPWDDDDGA
jgi:hypothetical protein